MILKDRALSLLAALSCCAFAMNAQEVTASITGSITDSSGALVAGATVTATNDDTNIARSTTSSPSGDFLIPLLRPGHYHLAVAQAGFKTFERHNIVLEINQRLNTDVILQIGQRTERIQVTSEPPTITTENAALGKVIDNKSISQIPLNGRLNIVGLLALAPGIQNAGDQDSLPNYGITPTVNGGSTTRSVGFSLDGITNSSAWIERGYGEFPPLDGIQEFKVITSSANAEFGKANQVIVVTKGGTNTYHGTLLAYNRNRVMAAKTFFSTALAKPQYNRNEFGGNFSGPITIPHFYNGRNRSFFFFNYEGFRRRQATTISTSVPTAAMRAGVFSGLTTITDPLNGPAPFPNNTIPSSRFNDVTLRLQDLYPLPNKAGTGAAGTGINLTQNLPLPEHVDRYSFRIDHTQSTRDQFSFTFAGGLLGPNPSAGPVSTFGGLAAIGEHVFNYSLNWNHVFSPTVIGEMRVGYLRQQVWRTPQNYKLDPSDFIPGLPAQDIGGVPKVTITNIVPMAEAGSLGLEQQFQAIYNLSAIRGPHTLKAGFDYQHNINFNLSSRSPQRGAFTFNGRYSKLAYADFLLGYPNTTQRPNPSTFRNRFGQNRYRFFIQDDWRVTPTLTINLGLRHELQVLQPQVYGWASLFVPGSGLLVFNDQFPTGSIPTLINAFGIRLSKNAGLPSALFDYLGQDSNNVAPRIGLAYKATDRTVLRAGYGIYYEVLTLNSTEQLAAQMPFGVVETFEQPSGAVPRITMTNPFPGTGTVPGNPTAASLDKTITPYNMQWNVTLEHQFPHTLAGRLSYLGQRNLKQLGNNGLNDVLPAPGAVQARRPYQPYSTITLYNSPIYQSTVHSLQGGLQKRYSSGLLLSAEYQYVRAIGTETYQNPTNYNDSRGSLSGIRKHVFTVSYLLDLPFGNGKMLFRNATGVCNTVISGWQLSGLTQALAGSPFSPSFTTTVVGSVGGRPDVVPGASLYPEHRSPVQYFNPAAFSVPANYTFGNAGYGLLWGPGQQSWDLSLAKSIAFHENTRLQLRMDAFSAFNHPIFGNPNTTITNIASVGRISSASGNRTVQLGAKLQF